MITQRIAKAPVKPTAKRTQTKAAALAFAGALGLAMVSLPQTAAAQSANNWVNSHTDWHVFDNLKAGNEHRCWSVSAPKESVNTKDGRVVAVSRGETLLYVSYAPGENVSGQISFTGGYPFGDGTKVTVDIGGSVFDMYTQGDFAWSADAAADQKIIDAMKRGATAILSGVSGRGTQTKDTFSLLGFTAGIDEAAARCK